MNNTHYPAAAFIGAGNMAHCLISGLIANGYPAKQITASHPRQERLDLLASEFNIRITTDNLEAAKTAAILVLAVKPQMMQSVLTELKTVIAHQKPLIISIASGVTVEKIAQCTGIKEIGIVRCMPNIAAFVQSSATGMYANQYVTPLQRDLAENILRAAGLTLWINQEKLIDVIAAVSGSGPAYFFLIMEALENASVEMGLSLEDARLLISQTVLGSARLALSSEESPVDLRMRVTSKGGTTERAIAVLEDYKLREAFKDALTAAYQRAMELADLVKK